MHPYCDILMQKYSQSTYFKISLKIFSDEVDDWFISWMWFKGRYTLKTHFSAYSYLSVSQANFVNIDQIKFHCTLYVNYYGCFNPPSISLKGLLNPSI